MGAAPKLIVLRNGETVGETELEGEISVGRSGDNVVRLDDRAISRRHLVFRQASEGVRVERLSEFAPLSVNGAECTTAVVREGDVVSIGPYLMRVRFPETDPEPAPVLSAPESADDDGFGEPAGEVEPSQSFEEPAVSAPDEEPPPADFGSLSLESPGRGPEEADVAAEMPAEVEAEGSNAFNDLSIGLSAEVGAEMSDGSGGGFAGEAVSADDDSGKTRVGAAANVRVVLVFPPGTADVTEFEITGEEVVIGRGKSCDVVLNDKKASRKNTLIRRAGLSFSVKDLESANGTFVNGVRIEEQELTGDDSIRIGDTEFRFKATSADYEQGAQNFLQVEEEIHVPDQGIDGIGRMDGMGGFTGDAFMPVQQNSFGMSGAQPAAFHSGVPGLGGVSAVPGRESAKPSSGNSLLAKFRAMDPVKRKKAIMYLVVLAFVFDTLVPDEELAPPPKAPQAARAPGGEIVRTFEQLSPEQRRFVESQHALAFDLYRNKEYDNSLFEIRKIFQLIPDYKDSKEIERYAIEGKRKLEALKEEKRRKEEEARLKAKIVELAEEAQVLMNRKDYDTASRLFPQILALDPENQMVARWQKIIDEHNEEVRIAEQQKRVQAEINRRAWDIFKEGETLLSEENYREAIEIFGKIKELGATDGKVVTDASGKIDEALAALAAKRDPVLDEAKSNEDAGELAAAYKLYEKATEIDPDHQAGFEGMNRIRDVLIERARVTYTEAVIAESYSDWEMARKKYEETIEIAPRESEYQARAKRKLARFRVMLPDAPVMEDAF